MNYTVKEYEVEFQSKDYPKVSFQEFEKMVDQKTAEFVNRMAALNVQFVALQDLSPLGAKTQFFAIAGCLAVRRIYQYDGPSRNHFVRLEASAVVESNDVSAMPTEAPVNVKVDETALRAEFEATANVH